MIIRYEKKQFFLKIKSLFKRKARERYKNLSKEEKEDFQMALKGAFSNLKNYFFSTVLVTT